ncbi:hypothetical protein ACHAQH_007231 [Verticillium albo-atrum]
MHILGLTALLLSCLATSPAQASSPRKCPPLGAVFPPAPSPRSHPRVAAALEGLSRDLLSSAASWNNSALSVGVQAAADDELMLDVHRSPPGARPVGGETVYRVGSVMFVDMAVFPGDWEALGLPRVEPAERPACSGFLGTEPCTKEDLLRAYRNSRPPVCPPNHAPVYSNAGIALVGLVVEAAAGKPYDEVIRELILEPAGMRSTTVGGTLDDNSTMFVPVNNTDWNCDIGIFDAAGGMFTTTRDLLAFARSILTRRLLTPSRTRRWLKPASFTSGWGTSVGAPWEILRLDSLLPSGRIVDVYTKGGDLAGYVSTMALVPDLGLAVTVVAAGPEMKPVAIPLSRVLEVLVPALEEAARDEARGRYAGMYEDEETGSRIVLVVEEEGEGLLLTEWVMRGFDVLANLHRYNMEGFCDTETPPREGRTLRLFPTLVETEHGTTEAWRAAIPLLTEDEAEWFDGEVAWRDGTCLSWLLADRATYNYLAVDHFDFILGDDDDRGAVAVPELEAPPCIAFEMPATPVEEEPCLRERPIATTTNNHHLNPRPSASRLSLSATSYPSTSSLHRDPSSIPLPPSRAVTPTPPDLTPSSSAVVSSSTLQTEDCPPTPLDCPPANYPQAKRPALKLFGSKKAKRWLDSTVDGTQGRLNTAVKPYVSNPRYNPKNWTTIAQAASHRYLEGKLYGPKGRYPHGEDVDEGVVGRPKLPARPGARAGAGAGAVVLAGEQEVAFPAVGLAPMVVRKKTR